MARPKAADEAKLDSMAHRARTRPSSRGERRRVRRRKKLRMSSLAAAVYRKGGDGLHERGRGPLGRSTSGSRRRRNDTARRDPLELAKATGVSSCAGRDCSRIAQELQGRLIRCSATSWGCISIRRSTLHPGLDRTAPLLPLQLQTARRRASGHVLGQIRRRHRAIDSRLLDRSPSAASSSPTAFDAWSLAISSWISSRRHV